MSQKKLLGQILVENNLITADELNKALALQNTTKKGQKLGLILVEEDYINETDLVKFLGMQTKSLIDRANNDFDEMDLLIKDIN